MTDGGPAIVARGVRKVYARAGATPLPVLDIAGLTVPAGGWTALRGRSGSGKTTLLNLIAGIARPTAGSIEVAGVDVAALPEARRDAFRMRHVGYVFQSFNLLAALSALENVMLAMTFARARSHGEQRARAAAILTRLGLADRLAHRPHQLSRGEQQRVAIARALVHDPPILLADEPCASLDAASAHDVLGELVALCRGAGTTVLVASHDDAVLGVADRVLDMAELNRAGRAPVAMASA
jgi:putative ABC transport system ATP-binding protein